MRAPGPRLGASPQSGGTSAACRRDLHLGREPMVPARGLCGTVPAQRGHRSPPSSNPFRRPTAVAEAQQVPGFGSEVDLPLGVVIVDHGSRRKEANGMLDAVVEAYRMKTGEEIVEPAHMEIAQPTLPQAICKCVDQGAKTVIVTPYFLSNGRHIQDDIPSIVDEATKLVPGVKCIIANALGVDPLIVDLLQMRVIEALDA